MSLKLRITAWFTLMILILTALVVTIVFVVADESLADDPVEELVEIVSKNASFSGRKDGKGDREYITYRNGVYCQIFDENGECVAGTVPDDAEFGEDFKNGVVSTYKTDTAEYYVYDMKVENSFWIRGYISAEEPSETTGLIILSTAIVLPVVLALSIFGGWMITKRSFKCVDSVIASSESINSGEDLSRRINLEKGPDEIRKMSSEFDKMLERLEKSFEAEKQFASDASHELKTPVTVAMSQCHRMKNYDMSPEASQSLEIIEKQCVKMSGIIESLMNITALQQKTDSFKLKLMDISEFLKISCEDYALENGISLEKSDSSKSMSLNIEENVFVKYNPDLMSRVIFNLLENSKKYTGENGEISVRLESTQSGASITFSDNGIGISEENISKIWNRFWQADKSKGVDMGLGLGLNVVKEAVRFQNGKITVESEEGKGTSFKIELVK